MVGLREYIKGKVPDEVLDEVKRSFEIVGDIAIIEIPDSVKKHEELIGRALMDVNSNIKVVLKKDGIHKGEYRTQDLIHIAGENRKETIYQENAVKLKVNPETVYFSAKLSTEREQLMSKLEPERRILVMFSGMGPYTFVALKKQPNLARITSIEINPQGHKYAIENRELNKNMLKKSKLFEELIGFLRINHIKVKEKQILLNLARLKVGFLNDDVKKAIKDLIILPNKNQAEKESDNILLDYEFSNCFHILEGLKTKKLYFDFNFPICKVLLKYVLCIFLDDFNFICKINDKEYTFDNDLKKGLLLNYLEYDFNMEEISYFDEIFMPLPKDAEMFLEQSFEISTKGTIVHMYDFVHEDEFPKLSEDKVRDAAKKNNKEVEILQTRKVGQYSPRKYRVCCDFKILN